MNVYGGGSRCSAEGQVLTYAYSKRPPIDLYLIVFLGLGKEVLGESICSGPQHSIAALHFLSRHLAASNLNLGDTCQGKETTLLYRRDWPVTDKETEA